MEIYRNLGSNLYQLAVGLGAYALLFLVFAGLNEWLKFGAHLEGIALSLLPVVFVAWALQSILKVIANADELQRRIELEALAFAVVPVTLLIFAYGFLESAGFPKLSVFVVWAVLALSRAVGLVVASRRYR